MNCPTDIADAIQFMERSEKSRQSQIMTRSVNSSLVVIPFGLGSNRSACQVRVFYILFVFVGDWEVVREALDSHCQVVLFSQ